MKRTIKKLDVKMTKIKVYTENDSEKVVRKMIFLQSEKKICNIKTNHK
jgi:hypothetical protein